MTKEEAKKRQAMLKCKIETCKDSIKYLNGKMSELEAIINKKDDWRDKLIQPNSSAYFYIGFGVEGVTTYADRNTDRKPEYAFRKPSHAQLLADKIQLMQEMHAFAHARNEGWIADWRGVSQKKFGIFYSTYKGFEVNQRSFYNEFIFGISVKSMEIADEMFEEFGERIAEVYNKQS